MRLEACESIDSGNSQENVVLGHYLTCWGTESLLAAAG